MEDIVKAVFGFCGFVGVMCLIVALFSLPTMWLINGLLAPSFIQFVFGTSHIGWLEALGITLLCSILFKGASSSKED